jgi:hypothetical protein
MSEANRTRRGGGINLKENSHLGTSTTPSPDTRFARSGSTPPVQEGKFWSATFLKKHPLPITAIKGDEKLSLLLK